MDFRVLWFLSVLIGVILAKPLNDDSDELLTTTEVAPTEETTIESVTITTTPTIEPGTESVGKSNDNITVTTEASTPRVDYNESENFVESDSPYDYDPIDQLAMESGSVQSVVMVAPPPKNFQTDDFGPGLDAMFVVESDLAMVESEAEDPTASPVAFVSIAPDQSEVLVPIEEGPVGEVSESVEDPTEAPVTTTIDSREGTTTLGALEELQDVARDQPETLDVPQEDDKDNSEMTSVSTTETIDEPPSETTTTSIPNVESVTELLVEVVEDPFEQVVASNLCSSQDNNDPLKCGSGQSKAELEDLNQGNDVRLTLEDVVFHNRTVNSDGVIEHQVVKKGEALSREAQVEGSLLEAEGIDEELPAEYRLLQPWRTITTTSTSIVAISTDILTVFSSCWRTAVPMTTCTGSMLNSSRRRRRSPLVVEQPLLDVEGQARPFTPAIQATKASQYEEEEDHVIQDSQNDRSAWAKLLLTYEQVEVLNVTSTVTATIVGNGYETLRFTSDLIDPGCLPLDFLASNAVGPC